MTLILIIFYKSLSSGKQKLWQSLFDQSHKAGRS